MCEGSDVFPDDGVSKMGLPTPRNSRRSAGIVFKRVNQECRSDESNRRARRNRSVGQMPDFFAVPRSGDKWPIRILSALPCPELVGPTHCDAIGASVLVASNFVQYIGNVDQFPANMERQYLHVCGFGDTVWSKFRNDMRTSGLEFVVRRACRLT